MGLVRGESPMILVAALFRRLPSEWIGIRRRREKLPRSKNGGLFLFTEMVFLWFLANLVGAADPADPSPSGYFGIRVIDAQTGRGVPLVELRTVHEVSYWTDSAGWAAIDDPELMNRQVFFHVRSHGYSLPADGFGFRGVRLWVRPGGRATIRLERQNIAERMYRITGAGIYRDSSLLGQPLPPNIPLVRAEVAGQDSVQAAVYQGKIYWFWGDTTRLSYPLGNFRTTGAVSPLPGQAGFDPNVSVPLEYFTGSDGRCKNLCPFEPKEGMIWIDGLVVVPEPNGGEKLVAHYARMKSLGEMLEHGLALWDEQRQEFQIWVRFPKASAGRTLMGHPFRYGEAAETARLVDSPSDQGTEKPGVSQADSVQYIYCGLAFPNMRVRASLEALADPTQYETWTCLAEEPPPEPSKSASTPSDSFLKKGDSFPMEEISIGDSCLRGNDKGKLNLFDSHPRESGVPETTNRQAHWRPDFPLPGNDTVRDFRLRRNDMWGACCFLSNEKLGQATLAQGALLPQIKRDPDGKPFWRWSRSAPPIPPALEHQLLRAGQLRPEDTYFLPVDVQSGKPVEIHSGSVRWNPWRKRWILIGVQQGGSSSFLGEVWYAEADSPVGPWRRAVKILTHDRYSFYNPVHHDFLDQQSGRIIFFEGTYSHSFSGNPTLTPRYDYNQIMYRLDLADPRLQAAQK